MEWWSPWFISANTRKPGAMVKNEMLANRFGFMMLEAEVRVV